MKLSALGILIIIITIFLVGCSGPIDKTTYNMPESGEWYCADLDVHISLERINGKIQPSYAVINGDDVTCICEGEYNTPYLFLICQESGVPGFSNGDIIYWWTLVEYSEDQMILEDYENGAQVCFDRVL